MADADKKNFNKIITGDETWCFELKKVCVFLMCLRFIKKSVLKLLGHTVYTEAVHTLQKPQ